MTTIKPLASNARDPTLAEQVGELGDTGNRLDMALLIADLALDIADQTLGHPIRDTEKLRAMLTKLKER